jgi:hypothetical protein
MATDDPAGDQAGDLAPWWRDAVVTIDIVPDHSSDQHPWFQEALRPGAGAAWPVVPG